MAWDSVMDDAMDEWHKRIWACVHVKGGHFEHLILFKSTNMLTFISKCIKIIAVVDLLYFTR